MGIMQSMPVWTNSNSIVSQTRFLAIVLQLCRGRLLSSMLSYITVQWETLVRFFNLVIWHCSKKRYSGQLLTKHLPLDDGLCLINIEWCL